MKPLLTILILFLCINLQAQTNSYIKHSDYSQKDAVIGAGIIYITFITVEANGKYMSKNQIALTAFTGMVISAGFSLYKNTDFGKRIQRRFYLRKRKNH